MVNYLETERLIIRKFSETDLDDLLLYTSDEEVMKYLPENPYNKQETQKFISDNIKNTENLAVVLKDQNKVIGHIVFHIWYEPFRTWEIGWVFNKNYHNKGYATEAALKVLEYGFEKLNIHRMIATCDPRNTASYKVMEKLNMRREGRNVKCVYIKGSWQDEYFYAMLEEEWDVCKDRVK